MRNRTEEKLIIHDIRDKIFWAIRIRYAVVVVGFFLFTFAIINDIYTGLVLGLVPFLAFYNLVAHAIYRFKKQYDLVQIIAFRSVFQVFDVLAITYLIYSTGCLESPYWFLYLVLIVVSGFGALSYAPFSVLMIATFSAVFYLGLLMLTYSGILPTYGACFIITPQQLLQSLLNRAVFTTISFFLFAATIYYFSKLVIQHRQELAQKNRELLATLQELKDIDRLKDDFVINASHELRTPLSVIRENVSLIEDGVMGAANQKQKELLKIARLNVDHLASILDGLLDISRIESRTLELKHEVVNIAWLASLAIELLQSKAAEKKLVIEALIPEKLEAWVDSDQVLRLFTNLIENAIKYSKEKGRIIVGLEASGRQIKGYVSDTGIGIAKADLDKIFERFVRIKDEKSGVVRGSGLGLSICKGIIELHGGKIWAESQAGEGAKLSFVLPRIGI